MSNYTKEKPKEEIDVYNCPECDIENDGKEGEYIVCFDCGGRFYAL